MADQQLKVIITADASGVGPGIAEATAAVSASADQMRAAQAKLAASTAELASLEKMLAGAVVRTGTAMDDLVTKLENNVAADQAAVNVLAERIAAEKAAAAAAAALAKAQDQDTKATYNRMEAMGSARVAMGAMDGSMGMMAGGLARLAAGSQVLGPLLQSMVPIAVMAAGAFILVDLVEGLIKFGDEAQELAADLGSDWLSGAMSELEGFGKQIKATQKDIDSLIKDMDVQLGKQKELSFAAIGRAGGPEEEATARAQNIQLQIDGTKALIESQKILLAQDQEQADKAAAVVAMMTDRKSNIPVSGTALSAAIAESARAQQLVRDTQTRIDDLASSIRTLEAEATKVVVTMPPPKDIGEGKGSKVAADNLPEQIAQKQIELTHAKDGELSADQKIVEEMNKQIALNDLKAKTSKEGTAAERETLRVIEDQIAVDKAFTALDKLAADEKKKADEAAKKSQADALRQQDEDLKTVDDQLVKQHKAQVDAARDKAELAIQSAALDFELSQEEIRAAEQSGRMSHKVAEQKLQDALRLKEQQTSVARQEEMGVLKPGAFEEDTRSYKKMQDQMVLEAKRGALERERITDQETNKMEQAYKKAANEFNRDFERAFNEWATKSKTAGQAFGRMLGEMELQVIDFAAKWLLEQAEMWAMHKVMQSLALGQEAAKNTTANTQAIISDAAKGAAGAEAAAAPAGPEAMAAAGAVATVMIMSNLSTVTMDTGGMMPHMGFAFNASGSPERVLSPSQTHNFESLVNNGGSRSAVLHQTNNYGGAPTKEMHEAQTAHTINRLKSMLRPEAFA